MYAIKSFQSQFILTCVDVLKYWMMHSVFNDIKYSFYPYCFTTANKTENIDQWL